MRVYDFFAAGALVALTALSAGAAPSKPDAALLQKAVAALEQSPSLEFTSNVVTSSAKQELGGTLRTQVRFARAPGGRFHCTITILPLHGQAHLLYETVGDGRQVWTYAAQVHQYTVAPETVYCRSVNLGLHLIKLGLLGALLAGSDAPGRDLLHDVAALAAHQGQSDGTVSLGSRPQRQIFLNMGSEGTLRLLLDPRESRIRQLTFTGRGPQAYLVLKETLVRQTLNAKLSPALFRFVLPPGAQHLPPPANDFLP